MFSKTKTAKYYAKPCTLVFHTLPAQAASTATLIIFTSLILHAFLSPLIIRTEVSHLRIHYFMLYTHTIIGILKYPF